METSWELAKRNLKYIGGSKETEDAMIKIMADEVSHEVEDLNKKNSNKPFPRPQHTKMVAGIKNAAFIISDTIPGNLSIGFLKPGNSYTAIVRFSNARATIESTDNSKPDLRGVAIKLMLPDGKIHDFLMTNAEQHHARNAWEALSTTLAFYKEDEGIFKNISNLSRRVGFINAISILLKLAGQSKKKVESMATETFYSRAPLRIGNEVVKYRLNPLSAKSNVSTSDLGTELKNRLGRGDVIFDFQVQFYINEKKTNLENARKKWDSEFITIAKLVIKRENLTLNKEDIDEVENIRFNPWNVEDETNFEPLGNMNRARKNVYAASLKARN